MKAKIKKAVSSYLKSIGRDDSYLPSLLHNVALKPVTSFGIVENTLILNYAKAKREVNLLARVHQVDLTRLSVFLSQNM